MKRIAAITLILALLLCGCGPDSSEAAASVPISIDETSTTVEDSQVPPYYSVEYFPASTAFAEARTYIWQEGQVLCALTGGANDDYERSLCWADPYSGDAQEILSLSGSEAISCYCIGTDGLLYAVVSDIVEDALDGPEDTGLTWDGCSSSRLVCMDAGGQPLYELPLDQDGATRYTDIAANAAGEVFVFRNEYDPETGYFSNSYLDRLDSSGVNATLSIQDYMNDPDAVLSGFLTAQDGTLLLVVQIDEWPKVYTFDMDSLSLSGPYFAHTSDMMWPTLSSASYADFYVMDDNTGLTAYTLDGQSHNYFTLSDLPSTVPDNASLVAVPEENVWLFSVYLNNTRYLAQVTGLWEEPEPSGKIPLTVGTTREYAGSVDLAELVVSFNILNPEYELVLKDYSQDAALLDTEAMREQLNLDILNGEGPDILVLSEYTFPCSTYAANGFLADLYPLMDADPDFQRSDYYENIWSAYENRGQLYGLIASFEIETMYTSSDYVDVPNGWTPTECQQITASSEIPLLEGLSSGLTYQDRRLAQYLLGDGLSDYIDGDTCDFTSGEFAALLELLAADYPTFEEETVEDSLLLKNGKVLAEDTTYAWNSMLLTKKWEYGDNWVITGYPTPSRSRIRICPFEALGISQQTEYPEVCWSFLKMALETSDSDLSQGRGMGFSVNKSVMENTIYRATLPAGDPDTLISSYSYGINDETVEVDLEPLTQTEAEELLSLIETAQCAMVDAETIQIVQEEVAAFFSGDKTAQQVAEIIQNRVQLHLWEQG